MDWAGRNESEVDKVISVYVKGVKVRTPDIVKVIFEATVLEIRGWLNHSSMGGESLGFGKIL